jgi:hypothetical protein
MATKRRQHYVPKFLLRRFAAREGRWQGHVFRLDTKTGQPRPAVPRTEAAKNRYYDLPDDLFGEFQPERVLEKIESGAAAAINRLEAGHDLRQSDLIWLAYFSSLQTSRTPQDRAERRYLDEVMAQQLEELRFSARDQATAFLRQADPTLTVAQAEERRREIVSDLGAGRIRIESTPEREIAGMFLGLNEAVGQLVAECDWTLVLFPAGPAIVLPDTGYTRYDRQPRVPGSGSGFLGSDTVETVIPVSPTAALVVTRGAGRVQTADGTVGYGEDLNLRAHAQGEVCVYGRTQDDVVAAHRLARRQRPARAERRRRARTLWISEQHEGDGEVGPVLFTGYSIDGIRSEWFHIDPRARRGQRGLKPEDLWR